MQSNIVESSVVLQPLSTENVIVTNEMSIKISSLEAASVSSSLPTVESNETETTVVKASINNIIESNETPVKASNNNIFSTKTVSSATLPIIDTSAQSDPTADVEDITKRYPGVSKTAHSVIMKCIPDMKNNETTKSTNISPKVDSILEYINQAKPFVTSTTTTVLK